MPDVPTTKWTSGRRAAVMHGLAALAICFLFVPSVSAAVPTAARLPWQNDFASQPVEERPRLEVRYEGGSRTAFEILAADYHLRGSLRGPHELRGAETGELWLSLSVEDASGVTYTCANATGASRINLYRRGPYYCEIHWLDLTAADAQGKTAPLRGDLALYCYPDQLLGSITWHATADFDAGSVRVLGREPRQFRTERFTAGQKQRFAFSLHGVRPPLPEQALRTLSAAEPLHYDSLRGCYTIGTRSLGGFEAQFYEYPNDYERAALQITNDQQARTIYVCHRTSAGDRGSVECGVLLDAQGHTLPITVQTSKNFSGEKEEKFYNPTDEPFSETWFPLVLAPGERCELTSLHLYQNWGRHMVKQFSSLGAWMDYFHSSSGVTETTCFVPFKFRGLSGIDIADFRAMSQTTFWGSQPQHDNVGGHSFLSYEAGEQWHYLEYRGTTYGSTGPNWMDITLHYLSTDGKVRAAVRTFELPQHDELRNFIQVRYELLAPLRVRDARERFRLVSVASHVQRLRYTHFASSAGPDVPLSFERDHAAVPGQTIPPRDSFMALYGESKGSNAILLRSWKAPFPPAAAVWCETKGNTRMCLVPGAESLDLRTGDVIEFDAVLMPYGEVTGAEACRRETVVYGSQAPRITQVTRGSRVSDFPSAVKATDDEAEFVLQGGRDLVPLLIAGLSDYRGPTLERLTSQGWQPLALSRADDKDGVQVFCEAEGRFAAVLLAQGGSEPQRLRFGLRPDRTPPNRMTVRPSVPSGQPGPPLVQISSDTPGELLGLEFPAALDVRTAREPVSGNPDPGGTVFPGEESSSWSTRTGNAIQYQVRRHGCLVGGRLTPNEYDVDLEFWIRNERDVPLALTTWFAPVLAGTSYDDPGLERTWVLLNGKWVPLREAARPAVNEIAVSAVAIEAQSGHRLLGFVWPGMRVKTALGSSPKIQFGPAWPECPPGRRAYRSGKVYWAVQTLDELRARVE